MHCCKWYNFIIKALWCDTKYLYIFDSNLELNNYKYLIQSCVSTAKYSFEPATILGCTPLPVLLTYILSHYILSGSEYRKRFWIYLITVRLPAFTWRNWGKLWNFFRYFWFCKTVFWLSVDLFYRPRGWSNGGIKFYSERPKVVGEKGVCSFWLPICLPQNSCVHLWDLTFSSTL